MDEPRRIDRFRTQLRQLLPELSNRFDVESLSLFGSYVRNENRADSDLDILVSFRETPGLLRYIELENYLSDLLGVRVDLVHKDSLKPEIGKRVLTEAIAI
jgi:uncharacterized protein